MLRDLEEDLAAWQRWDDFELGLRSENRVVSSPYAESLLDHCLSQVVSLDPSTLLYRARLMDVEFRESEGPHPPTVKDIGAPSPHLAMAGRLNPEGIPYLYLASDPDTAIAELRPWGGAHVTVGTFRLEATIQVVDLTPLGDGDVSYDLKVLALVLCYPPHREDRLAYVASQHLSEQLKARGMDGIMYRSSFRPLQGHNVALFDPKKAAPVETELHKVIAVNVGSLRVDQAS